MKSIAVKFGQRLKELRKKHLLTQDSLAEAAGLSCKHIGEIERGEVNLTIQSLEQIANALGLKVHELTQCDQEEDVGVLRKLIIDYIAQCPEEDYKLMVALR
jgi:transcriptional regulator with XRE-family HTH domain